MRSRGQVLSRTTIRGGGGGGGGGGACRGAGVKSPKRRVRGGAHARIMRLAPAHSHLPHPGHDLHAAAAAAPHGLITLARPVHGTAPLPCFREKLGLAPLPHVLQVALATPQPPGIGGVTPRLAALPQRVLALLREALAIRELPGAHVPMTVHGGERRALRVVPGWLGARRGGATREVPAAAAARRALQRLQALARRALVVGLGGRGAPPVGLQVVLAVMVVVVVVVGMAAIGVRPQGLALQARPRAVGAEPAQQLVHARLRPQPAAKAKLLKLRILRRWRIR